MLKKTLVVAALLTLVACGDTRGNHLTVANPQVMMPASLKSSVEVGQVTGGGSYLFDPDAVRDSEFKDALKKSLAANGMLAADNPAYKIDADISTHQSPWAATGNRVIDETVVYRVTRIADQKVFETIVKTSNAVPVGNFASVSQKTEAYNKVTGDNLTQFLQKLAAWNQGA